MLNKRGPKSILEESRFLDGVARFAVTCSKDKTSVSDKLRDYSDLVLIWQKPQQLAGKATVPDSAISSCQIEKYGTDLLLSFERIFDVLGQQNDFIYGWLPGLKPSLRVGEQWINNWVDAGIDKPFENLVRNTEQ